MNASVNEREEDPDSATAPIICGWKIRAAIPAITAAINKVAIAETLRIMSIAVRTGTKSNHGDMLNVFLRSFEKSAACAADGSECIRLTIRKITSVITNDGTVVTIMKRICVNNGVPAEDDARTVVSDRGETLSPK